MKKIVFIFFFIIPLAMFAQRTFTPEYDPISKTKDGRLRSRAWGNLNVIRDTILADGRVSHIYCASMCCYGPSSNQWRYVRLPDGVRMLISCSAEFAYPSDLEPGIYNFVEDWVKIVNIDRKGNPIVKTEWYAESSKYGSFPSSIADLERSSASSPQSSCTIQVGGKTIPLYGRVKVVSSFPDFTVKVVESFPDLRVQNVSSFPGSCGEWQFVEDPFPDFTIQYVESFPDLTIQFVSSFPGQ